MNDQQLIDSYIAFPAIKLITEDCSCVNNIDNDWLDGQTKSTNQLSIFND